MHWLLQVVLGVALMLGMQAFRMGPSRAPVGVVRKLCNVAHTAHSLVATRNGPWRGEGEVEPSRRLAALQSRTAGHLSPFLAAGGSHGLPHCRQKGLFDATELNALREANAESFWKDLLFGPIPEWAQKNAAGFGPTSLWIDSRATDDANSNDGDADAGLFPLIVFLHSGGAVSGSPASDKGLAYTLSSGTGYKVLALGYPLCPEKSPKEAGQAVKDALSTLSKTHPSIVLVSAGAGSSLVLLESLSAGAKPSAAVLFSPSSGQVDLASHSAHAAGDVLDAQVIGCFARTCGADKDNILTRGGWEGFPPTLIVASTTEALADDAVAISKKLQSAHGKAKKQHHLLMAPHLPHLTALHGAWFPEAAALMQEVSTWIKNQL